MSSPAMLHETSCKESVSDIGGNNSTATFLTKMLSQTMLTDVLLRVEVTV